MGILSRIRDIMTSNLNDLLEKSKDPEKTIEEFMKSINSDLSQLKAESASMLADERRAKRALDECTAEIRKLQHYAKKAAEAGDDDSAQKFMDKQALLAEKEAKLLAAYEAAAANIASMKQMKEKLEADIGQMEERRTKLKEKLAAAKVQQKMNAIGSAMGGNDTVFDAFEEKVNRTYDEAMAIAELRAEKKDNFDDLFEQFEKGKKE